MRKDIQGLRAIAVISVLLFHFWPERLTGGYVGVDIFFVISGFLITSHLLRKPPTSRKLLLDFWAKRIRRLLPAATLVLFVTIIASIIWLPQTMIKRMAEESAAAASYVENWSLAANATDYLNSTDAPSPIQHYWSLSVEEQYYAVWPIVIGLSFLAGRRWLSGKKNTAGAIGIFFVGSLVWSIYLTRVDPASAYFVTTTRIWELAIGGIVALASLRNWRLRPPVAAGAAWIGLAAIGATLLLFTEKTPFPSYTALLPTLGAALVIFAATDNTPWSPRRLLSWRPSQFIGDISYSIYLWHWPIIIIAPYALHATLHWKEKLLLAALAITLAAISKKYVEDPARSSKQLVKSNTRTFIYGVASVLGIVLLSFGVVRWTDAADVHAKQTLDSAINSNVTCVGAAALRDSHCEPSGTKLLMTPRIAKEDKAVLYKDNCWANRPFSAHKVCTYGDPKSKIRIALIGNSHAGMWFAAIEHIAVKNGWRLDTYLVSECYTILRPLAFSTEELTDNCLSWNRWAVDQVMRHQYNTVVLANETGLQIKGVTRKDRNAVAKKEYGKVIDKLLKDGEKVFVLRDAPNRSKSIPDCVAEEFTGNLNICSAPKSRVLDDDPLYDAAKERSSDSVGAVDLSDRICHAEKCLGIVGGLIVYFDYGHLSNSFVQTLYPDIEPQLTNLVSQK